MGEDNRKKGEVYGFDGGKKVKGRKRHIVVDSQGLVMGVLVTEANTSERLGAIIVLDDAVQKLTKLKVIGVDQGYSGNNLARVVKQICGDQVSVEVIARTSKTFERLPKRWMVERTFGWLNRFRRLSKDYELYTEVGEAMIYGSLIRLMVKPLVASLSLYKSPLTHLPAQSNNPSEFLAKLIKYTLSYQNHYSILNHENSPNLVARLYLCQSA